MPKLGTKNALFALFQKPIVIFEISTQSCQFAKFHKIVKKFNFGTKNTLIGDFWARTLKN